MVTPDGLQGIVDWEFAHWGDRHEDLTWLCMGIGDLGN
ncbi:phosphotransferase enzyme domain protein [Leptospira interrogans str. L1207]|nr:phosphotransferase enzyme domain protein [Leptospira interrogans str. L1207]